jgi:hypothetical protein
LSKEQALNSLYDAQCSFRENLHIQYIKKMASAVDTSCSEPPSSSAISGQNNYQLRKEQHILRQQNNRSKVTTDDYTYTNMRKKKSQYNSQFSSTNYFIFSLAVSDLIYNLILALVWVTRNTSLNVLGKFSK